MFIINLDNAENRSYLRCSYKRYLPEQHKNRCWHQKDLIAGDELQNVLLIGGKFVQEVSDKH